jgi:hypothetical protein
LGASAGSSRDAVFANVVQDLDMSEGKVGYCHPRASDSMMEG